MFIRILLALLLLTTPSWAVTQFNINIPAAGDSKSAWPAAVSSQWSILQTLLSNYRKGQAVIYKNSTTLTVSLGEVTVTNGSTYLFLQNSGNTDITSANIDAGGAFSNSTTYYVYCGTSSATAASCTYTISTNSTAPSGVTYYKKLGSFITDGSANIQSGVVFDEPYGDAKVNANGQPTALGSVYDYGSSTSSFTTIYSGQIKIIYGKVTQSSGSVTITNLPFSDTSYIVFGTRESTIGTYQSQAEEIVAKSASSFQLYDNLGGSKVIDVWAFGK